MNVLFEPARAETMADFLSLVQGWKLVISFVYYGPCGTEIRFDMPNPEPGERYLAFNLVEHEIQARMRFRETSTIARRLGEPLLRAVPYWASFVVGMGPYMTVYSLDDALRMIPKARKEVQILWKAFANKDGVCSKFNE